MDIEPIKPSRDAFRQMEPGTTKLFGPCAAGHVSGYAQRLEGVYSSKKLILTNPTTLETVAMYAVTRVK